MPGPLTALVIMASERSPNLLRCLAGLEARALTAATCSEAAAALHREPAVDVVLTDLALPDGSWCDVLNLTADLHPEAGVVVCARLADERLWTEVLDAGGFDILVEPFQEPEVRRIVTQASATRRLAAAF
jgi:DNA-binding NtrC family response regulator